MAKDTYYFSHDSNARNDIKIIRLRRALGMEGYGIYFALIEVLREQDDFKLPLASITDIAFDLHVSEEKVKTVVQAYDLFFVEQDMFFSARLLRSMNELNEKRQKYIDAGKKGGEASVKQRLSIGQPLNKSKVNKSKVNKSKEKESKTEDNKSEFVPPNVDDVVNYFLENGYRADVAQNAHRYYEANSWNDKTGKPVKNWKLKMVSVWFREEYKIPKREFVR